MLTPSFEGFDLLKTLSEGPHDDLDVVMFIWLHLNPELFDVGNNLSEDWVSYFSLSFFTSHVVAITFFFWLLKSEMSKKIKVLDYRGTLGWFDEFFDLNIVDFSSWNLFLVVKL
jgi:hypothetical protein